MIYLYSIVDPDNKVNGKDEPDTGNEGINKLLNN